MSDGDLQRLYQEATAARDRASCPSPEALLDPSDEVVSHIARCADCAREYRAARSAVVPTPGADTPRVRGTPPGQPATRWWLAAAAVVLLIAAPLIWMNSRLRDDVARAESQLAIAQRSARRVRIVATPLRPQVGTPIVDLDAAPLRGEATAIPLVEVPRGASIFTLILHLPERRGDVDLELRDAGDRVLWRGKSSAKESSITLALSRDIAPAGDYVVRAGSASFRFRVHYGA